MLDIIKAHAKKNLCYIANKKMTPKGIVVHSTGANNPYLKRYVDAPKEVGENKYSNHWNVSKPDGRKVCVHAFIGYDKNKQIRVAEILPLNICCWGVGKGKNGSYNYEPAYIQFEICEDDLCDKTYYEQVFAIAAEYCAELCEKYNISIEKIEGHCEAYRKGFGSNHSDPEHWMSKFGESMYDFRKRVSEILKTNEGIKENKEETIFKKSVIEKGDLVSINSDAVYYYGEAIPLWVKNQKWYVRSEPIGKRVVIDSNQDGTDFICSPIDEKYLSIVKKANEIIDKPKVNQNIKIAPYMVKVLVERLDIRKNVGLGADIVGSITDKGVYTIIEEKTASDGSKWGKLKSKMGWIPLEYVKKI